MRANRPSAKITLDARKSFARIERATWNICLQTFFSLREKRLGKDESSLPPVHLVRICGEGWQGEENVFPILVGSVESAAGATFSPPKRSGGEGSRRNLRLFIKLRHPIGRSVRFDALRLRHIPLERGERGRTDASRGADPSQIGNFPQHRTRWH